MNIHYNPQKFGLQLFGEIDFAGAYEFDLVAVWKHGSKFLYGEDSGCSCPTPFEDQGLDDLKEIVSLAEFQNYLKNKDDDELEQRDHQIAELIERLHKEGLR